MFRHTLLIVPFLIFGLSSSVSTTNLTEQFQLCKSTACIENIRETHNLTQVVATPTHAAFQPGWPSTLYTFGLSIFSLIAACGSPSEIGPFWFLANNIIPLVLVIHWVVGWGITMNNGKTAGYVAVNLFTGLLNINCVLDLNNTQSGDGWAFLSVFLVIPQLMASVIQLVGTLVIVFQRGKELGTVAYNITDTRGCLSHNGLGYLEQGARSHAFRGIQIAQVVWAYVSLPLLYTPNRKNASGKESSEEIKVAVALSTLVISFPILIYEIVIATKGRPVVLSGNCMLVELDPKLGFWDSEIDNWWKVISMLPGL